MAERDFDEQFQALSIGERLKQAREGREMSLDDVASQTRIPTRHLQHIEREEWDALPAVTYCLGFVRAYANMVGLDGPELSRELRDQIGGLRRTVPVADYYEPADPSRVPPRSLAIFAAVVALVLIVGYAIWRGTLGGDAPPAGVTLPVAEATAPQPARPRPAAPAPAAPQALAGQPVTLAATGEAWMRIEDGGATLFQGTLGPGQRFQIPPTAQRPVIRTGRPQVLRALVGARDLGPLEPVERTVSNLSLRPEDLAARLQGAAGAVPPPAPLLAPIPPQ